MVKITTFNKILDLIFPCYCRGCGKIGCDFCDYCKNYNYKVNQPFLIENDKNLEVFCVGRREGMLKKMVIDFKYHSNKRLSFILSEMMSDVYSLLSTEVTSSVDKFNKSYTDAEKVIVPLPTVAKHIRKRGFDHTLELAKVFGKINGFKVEQLIDRNRNTVQVGTDADNRVEQAKHAYKIRDKAKIYEDVNYLLIDDVWTTGSSMLAAVDVMKKAGASKVSCLVICKSM